MKLTPERVVKLCKYWPPFWAAGISVKEFDLDKGYVVSQLKMGRRNTNYYKTQYGGSLYSMCDPFFVFILAHRLGQKYFIWDAEASIRFVKATSDTVTARMEISDEEFSNIIQQASGGEKVNPLFHVHVLDSEGELVAQINKTLYVKLKPEHRQGAG